MAARRKKGPAAARKKSSAAKGSAGKRILPTTAQKAAAQVCVPACGSCGYRFTHLHAGQCPLCKPCPRCQMRVRHCVCKEGE